MELTSPLKPQMGVLAGAFERHLALLASRGHRKAEKCVTFAGANESTIMLIADRIFTGLGYLTWPEHYAYGNSKQRADLWAASPTGEGSYLIEGKVIWDGVDKRLNRTRFFETRELLNDFERLSRLDRSARKVVIWVAFSADGDIVSAAQDAKTMRLGDAITAIAAECQCASLEAKVRVDFENFCDRPEYEYGHVLCWLVP